MQLNTERLLKFFTETLKESLPIANFDLYKDSQTKFVLEKLSRKSGEIDLLDYGSGTLRLLYGIENFPSKLPVINYYGTDLKPPDSSPAVNKAKYQFVNLSSLKDAVKKFDVVVLMNVIHEVSIFEIATIIEISGGCSKIMEN